MASQKTIKFEFLVDADPKQIDRFHDSLKRIDQASAVSEGTLTSLREELQRFSQSTIKTENTLQGQIAALRDASRNAALTKGEYVKLRSEVNSLEREYKELTTGIVGMGRAYEQAGRQAEAFNRRAAKIQERQIYEAGGGRPTAGTTGMPQVARSASGGLIGFPGVSTPFLGTGDAGLGQFGPTAAGFQAAGELKAAQAEMLTATRAHHQQMLQAQSSFAAQENDIRDRANQQMLADNKRANDAELADFDRRLENRERKKKERSRRMSDLGDVAQQVGIGAFFGGPEGLAGAAIGGLVGGPAGAMIGTTLGTGAQQLRMQAGMVGTLVAQLNLAKTSLAQVSKNQEDYNQRLTFARQVSRDYALGLESTISGYAKVSAAAAANNLTIQQTESIYRGITSAAVAFGGSQDDIQSAVIATVQVLSKGKVSAEELSGQIGERIPGAVAKFAAANNLSLKELSKALEEGKVNIAQFVKFLEKQTTDYDTIAKNIGNSTAKAGDRLNLELTRSAEIYGKFFQTLGAGFQDAATSLARWANSNADTFADVIARIKLFINDLKYEFKVLQGFIPTNLANQGIYQAPPSFTAGMYDADGFYTGGAGAANRSAREGEFTISSRMREQTLAEAKREKWLSDERARLLGDFNPPGFNRGNSVVPGDEVGGDGRTDKQRQAELDKQNRLIEEAAAIQRRQDELLAMNKINLAERVYEREQNLIRKKYELEKQLSQARQNAEEAWLTGVQRDVISQVNGLLGRMDDRRRQIVELESDVARAQKAQGFESQRASVTAMYADVGPSLVGTSVGSLGGSGTPMKLSSKGQALVNAARKLGVSPLDLATIIGFETGGSYSPSQWGGAGGNYMGLIQFGPNERRAYGAKQGQSFEEQVQGPVVRYFQDRFKGVGMSTQGASLLDLYTTVLAGNPRANRNSRDSFGTSPASGVAKMGPHRAEAMRRFFGGVPASEISRLQPGVAAGQNRGIKDMGQVKIAGVGVQEAQDAAALAKANAQEFNAQDILATAGQMTGQIRQQSEALADQKQELQLRNRLLMEGVRPELIEQEIERNKLATENAKINDALSGKLAIIKEKLGENSEEYRGLSKIITEINSDYTELIANQAALNEIANAPGAKVRERIGTLKQEINALTDGENRILSFADTIESSLGNAISSAVTEVSFGAGSIREIVIAMLKDISNAVIQSVAQIVAKQGAQSFLSLFGFGGGGGIGNAASGLGAAAFGSGGFGSITDLAFSGIKLFASGGVMTPDGPLPLRTYSRGGIANTPQAAIFGEGSRPEAYVPLPDGRRIPVAMSGGGGQSVNVVVNVDASGNQSVSGNSDEAGRLGRVVSAAVQAELAKQARPGGILAKR